MARMSFGGEDRLRASDEFVEWVRETEDAIADRHFFTAIAGVSFANDDGSNRQELIAQCREFDELRLEPEPDKRFHKQAVRVMATERDLAGRQLGYLDRRCAQEISNGMAAGRRFSAAFCERREAGHDGKDHIHGAVIVIFELNARRRAEVIAAEKAATIPEIQANAWHG